MNQCRIAALILCKDLPGGILRHTVHKEPLHGFLGIVLLQHGCNAAVNIFFLVINRDDYRYKLMILQIFLPFPTYLSHHAETRVCSGLPSTALTVRSMVLMFDQKPKLRMASRLYCIYLGSTCRI